ncbi:MAG: hypothetical protein ACOYT4_04265 [Nanoarchaeota archaeon]
MKLKPIPKRIIVNTGEQQTIQETIDDFFINTKKYLQSKYQNLRDNNFEIKYGSIAYNCQQITNDGIINLLYMSHQIASIVMTRTELNYVEYNFYRNLRGLERIFKI